MYTIGNGSTGFGFGNKQGGGSNIAQMLMKMSSTWGQQAQQPPPTASQVTALNAGAGPVNANTAQAVLPVGAGGAPAPAAANPYGINPYAQNPYYHVGFNSHS